jgi:hypothetical protein
MGSPLAAPEHPSRNVTYSHLYKQSENQGKEQASGTLHPANPSSASLRNRDL